MNTLNMFSIQKDVRYCCPTAMLYQPTTTTTTKVASSYLAVFGVNIRRHVEIKKFTMQIKHTRQAFLFRPHVTGVEIHAIDSKKPVLTLHTDDTIHPSESDYMKRALVG